ncbi:hypothetical protein ILUMI_20084 [Ignelater luminosus]|uniref:Reverse transcriptase domain-containing protein n=1 Tax=Ignelater luminosus TaxID=2038154 RepID=A0A8K0G2L4_IGNLU|nr:hypothetical protein ILUMI_20084 [Ignelater luminosus]
MANIRVSSAAITLNWAYNSIFKESSDDDEEESPLSLLKIQNYSENDVTSLSLIIEGNVRGTVRILFSNDTIAGFKNERFCLKEKHPALLRTLNFPEPPPPNHDVPTVSDEHHLKDLLAKTTGVAGAGLLSSLTALCNLVLSGKMADAVTNILDGANLRILPKKEGGVRPIAVGCTSRRVEFSSKEGCEAAVHALRYLVENNHYKAIAILEVDVKNAFNTLERDIILEAVEGRAPNIFPYLFSIKSILQK